MASPQSAGTGPLAGIRVLDLTTVVMGPYAARLLGDLGADVIKIEPPAGDPLRYNGIARNPGMSALFLQTNRSKRSAVLDLKQADMRAALLRLAKSADVFLHNYRPRAMARLGLSYADLAAANPRIVYCGMPGFAQSGPYADKPAYDDLLQGAVGIPMLKARLGVAPSNIPLFFARISGLSAAYATLAALLYRERTGLGQSVEVPMFETMAQFVLSDHLFGQTFIPPIGEAGYTRALVAERRPYPTKDGHLCANIYNNKHWTRFCELVGHPEVATDPRFADLGSRTRHAAEMCRFISGQIETRTTVEWQSIFEAADIPAMPLHTLDSLIADEHLRSTGFLDRIQHPSEGTLWSLGIPSRWSRTPPTITRHTPRLGEHTAEILAETRNASAAGRASRPAAPHQQREGPLRGLRVLDLSSVLMGPFATQIMGHLGADVIKVEPPQGDGWRINGPSRHRGMSALFMHANRSKRSLALDLKQPAGREALLKLAETADVLIHNIRPRAMARLGLAHEEVAARNPRIVYCSAVGYGQNGPYAAKPAYDELIQGAAAIPALEARLGGDPRYIPMLFCDRTVGLTVLYTVLAALLERERSGQGQAIEVAMFETMAQFVLSDHLGGRTFEPAIGEAGYARAFVRERGPFATADGFLCANVYNDKHWEKFCALAGRAELTADPRFADLASRTIHAREMCEVIAEQFARKTTGEWLKILELADIPAMPLQTLEGLLADPQLAQTGFFQAIEHPTEGSMRIIRNPVTFSVSQPPDSRPAPRLGEHSVEILSEAGYSPDDIRALVADKTIVDGMQAVN